jgi:hypothetical protein
MPVAQRLVRVFAFIFSLVPRKCVVCKQVADVVSTFPFFDTIAFARGCHFFFLVSVSRVMCCVFGKMYLCLGWASLVIQELPTVIALVEQSVQHSLLLGSSPAWQAQAVQEMIVFAFLPVFVLQTECICKIVSRAASDWAGRCCGPSPVATASLRPLLAATGFLRKWVRTASSLRGPRKIHVARSRAVLRKTERGFPPCEHPGM